MKQEYILLAAAGIVVVLVGIIIAYRKSSPSSNHLTILSRQAARWSTAAAQDDNPLIALLHANYGAAYLWAIEDIAEPREVPVKNYKAFKAAIIKEQDTATRRAAKICGLGFAPIEPVALVGVGGENV